MYPGDNILFTVNGNTTVNLGLALNLYYQPDLCTRVSSCDTEVILFAGHIIIVIIYILYLLAKPYWLVVFSSSQLGTEYFHGSFLSTQHNAL